MESLVTRSTKLYWQKTDEQRFQIPDGKMLLQRFLPKLPRSGEPLSLSYSVKLLREKTFANFDVLLLFAKFSPRNLGAWHLLVAPVSNL